MFKSGHKGLFDDGDDHFLVPPSVVEMRYDFH